MLIYSHGKGDYQLQCDRGRNLADPRKEDDAGSCYGISTRPLKRPVLRIQSRLPADFMFEVSPEETQMGGANLEPPT